MTWFSFLDLATLEHRNLFLAYAAVIALQGSYLGWVLHGLNSSKSVNGGS